tara:strand:- start:476 stop:871 length:396 start_codon:yes stop_codon:yes gene_type:complete
MDLSSNELSNNLDDVTLRLMSNKKGLKTYLKQNDDEEYNKIKYEEEILNIHRSEIIKTTYDLLDNNNNSYTSDIINSFNDYVKNIVKKIELSKISDSNEYNKDDDVIFTNMESNKKIISNVFGYEFNRFQK